jgi:hypothetical protein
VVEVVKTLLVAAGTAAAMSAGLVVASVSAGASTTETADRSERRVQATPTLAPPSAAEVCNSLTYYGYDPKPTYQCFIAVTSERGWMPQTQDAWDDFLVWDFAGVIQGESSHCWNMRFGDRIGAGEPCTSKRGPGTGEDSGFGQATCVLYCAHRGGVLCLKHGYCSGAEIVASPFDSMLASVVLLVEMGRPNGGSDPWCYDARARDYHDCARLAPDR